MFHLLILWFLDPIPCKCNKTKGDLLLLNSSYIDNHHFSWKFIAEVDYFVKSERTYNINENVNNYDKYQYYMPCLDHSIRNQFLKTKWTFVKKYSSLLRSFSFSFVTAYFQRTSLILPPWLARPVVIDEKDFPLLYFSN